MIYIQYEFKAPPYQEKKIDKRRKSKKQNQGKSNEVQLALEWLEVPIEF